ncbi:MAG TPA: hypothetical protein VL574_17710 [Stellaceae bacterium]|nr:hypothetical protein [Stellaceae bacterium]
MIEYFPTKRLRFDISVLMDGRWQIVGALDDGRKKPGDPLDEQDFDRLVQDVMARARQILAAPKIQAIKVMMEAVRANGVAVSREVLNLEAGKAAGMRNVRHHGGEVPLCDTYEDLLQRPALHTLGIILRPMLDRDSITPLELVTLKAIARSVQKNQQAFYEAMAVAARQQAATAGVPQKTRMEVLDKLMQQGCARLRAADQRRDLPAVRPQRDGFSPYLAAVKAKIPSGERRFWLLRGLSVLTDGASSYLGKLGLLLRFDPSTADAETLELLDEAIAGVLDQPDTVRDLLGHHLDLASAIMAMRNFAQGLPPKIQPELTEPLGLAIAQGRLPLASAAIWERLARSLAGQQTLTKQGAKEEWAALTKLQAELGAATPQAFQEPIAQALKKRVAEARQRLLER